MYRDLQGTGVYCWFNVVNKKRYIGSAARSFVDRRASHLRSLRRGEHWNSHLQYAWDKYGESAFRFFVIKRCPPEECFAEEQRYIDLLKSTDPSRGYNKCPTAGGTLGLKWEQRSRDKMSATRKRQCAGPAYRAQIGERFARPKTAEHKEKLRVAQTGKRFGKRHPDVGRKISAKMKGRKFSEAHKAALKAAAIRRWRGL